MGQSRLRSFITAALLACCCPAFGVDDDREQRFREYDARRMKEMEKLAVRGDVIGAMARLYLDKDVDAANRIVLEADLGHWLDHIPQLALYEMFNADTGHRAKLLSREATDKLHAHMWQCFHNHGKPPYGSCRHAPVDPNVAGEHWGNQNHGFVYQSWFATAASALGREPKYTAQFNPETHIFGYKKPADGPPLTLAAYAGDLDQLWCNRFPRMAKQGIWAEDAIYRCYGIASTYNLAYHSKNLLVRQRASMLLDLHWLIYALHMVDGQLGGAKNRFKPQYERDHFDRGLGQYYFGGQGGGFHSTEVALFGDYIPPQIAYDLLADPKSRGCFSYRERLTQFSSPGQPPRTYKYSRVTPEYVLGSYVAHDLDRGPGRYQERAFNGIVFRGTTSCRTAPSCWAGGMATSRRRPRRFSAARLEACPSSRSSPKAAGSSARRPTPISHSEWPRAGAWPARHPWVCRCRRARSSCGREAPRKTARSRISSGRCSPVP
jgi:hypothetical protein